MDSKDITHKCNKCKDKGGWVEKREADVFGDGRIVREEEVWVECQCAIQRKIERIVQASAITPEFQKMGFKNFETHNEMQTQMRDIAVKYYKAFSNIRAKRENSIALVGQVGAGKTHLLSAISNGVMKSYQTPVMYFPFVEMMEEMSADNYSKKEEIVYKAQQVNLLFIDDLFKPTSSDRGMIPRATPFMQTVMQAIINYRYLNNKPILLSCELDFSALLEINEALGSRLFEMCSDYVVQIQQDVKLNYRMRKLFKEGNNA